MNQRLTSKHEVEPADELLNRAFALAYFILGDRSASIYVAMAAMDKLKTAFASQGRRSYYTPTGRAAYPAARTKVNLSEVHLLQRLVYVESELFERLLEGQQRTLQQDDLIIRYIKHLIRITTRHNSFYVTLGLCRLLYNYSTGETSEIYNLVLQDPERMRDDYYYRSRKKSLMEDIKDRFGTLIRTQQGLRREERFQPQEDSQKYATLVKECLIRFTPWHSACVLPNELDPKRNVIRQLLFEGSKPDQEHQVELNRIHTLVHPACFDRLTAVLGLDPAGERLELPSFFVSSSGSQSPEARFNPSALSEGELDAIRRSLDKNVSQRQKFSESRLSLLVDGARKANFDLNRSSTVQFDIDHGSELIELRSAGSIEESNATIAACLLTYDQSGILPADLSVALGPRRRLSLVVRPATNALDEARGAALTVTCDQKPPVAIFESLPSWLFKLLGFRFRDRRLLAPALGLVFVAVLAAGLWIYFHAEKVSTNTSPVAKLEGDHEEQPSLAPAATAPPRQTIPSPSRSQSPGSISGQPKPGGVRRQGFEGLRRTTPTPRAAALLAVKRVYVDPLGADAFSRQLREALIDDLKRSNHFEVVATRDDADAVFKGSAGANQGSSTPVVLELVNAAGQVVWSLSSAKAGRSMSSDPAIASATIYKVLIRDIEMLEGKQ